MLSSSGTDQRDGGGKNNDGNTATTEKNGQDGDTAGNGREAIQDDFETSNDKDEPDQQQEEEKRFKTSSSKSLMSQASASTSASASTNSKPISAKSTGSTKSSSSVSLSSSSKNKTSSSSSNNRRGSSTSKASDAATSSIQEINIHRDHNKTKEASQHKDSSHLVPDSSKQEHNQQPENLQPNLSEAAAVTAAHPVPDTTVDKEEQAESLREKLEKSLQEEKMLLNLQMQLLTQVEQLDRSIAQVEGEERIARLAYQQANVTRLLQECRNETSRHHNHDDDDDDDDDGRNQDGKVHHNNNNNNNNDKEVLRISV